MTRERDESGQYVETVGPTDVLDVFGTVDGPVITSSDVADALDCTTEAARQKLGTLVAEGTLGVRKTGRTKVYWRDEDGPADTAVAPPDADTGGDRTESKTQPPSSEVAGDAPADAGLRERVEAALAAGEYAVTETRVDAALAVVGVIRSDGRVSSNRATRIAEEHGVSLGTIGQWWSETARELSVVETERGSNSYEWAGGES